MKLLTLHQAAEYLQMHYVTIYRLVRSKTLPFVKVGGRYRILKDKLDEKFAS